MTELTRDAGPVQRLPAFPLAHVVPIKTLEVRSRNISAHELGTLVLYEHKERARVDERWRWWRRIKPANAD